MRSNFSPTFTFQMGNKLQITVNQEFYVNMKCVNTRRLRRIYQRLQIYNTNTHLVVHSSSSLERSLRDALCFSSNRSFSVLAASIKTE